MFQRGDDRVEVWDADDFAPWEILHWPTVRVLRYHQHKRDGMVIQAEWLTNFTVAKLGSLSSNGFTASAICTRENMACAPPWNYVTIFG